MRRVWSSSGEQNSVKQTSECAVYLTSIQLDQQTVARANYRLSTPELLQLISWLLTRSLFFVSKELRNNLQGKCTRSPPSYPAAVNSICSLHAPKNIPKIIGAYIHAFLTFGFQKGDFAGFL